MPNPFIDQQDLSDYLGRDVTNDAGALMAVDAACDICRDIAEQSFNLGTTTASFDGTGTDCIVLPERPVVSVGTVSVNGSAITDYVATDRLLLRGSVGECSWSGWRPTWPRGRQNIEVSYVHGYGTADVPRSVRMVAVSIASRLIVQGPAQSETVGDVTMNYGMAASDLTQGELRVLNKYRAARSF